MAMMIISLFIRSFHRQPLEPIGCVMLTDLPRMSEPSCGVFLANRTATQYTLSLLHTCGWIAE